ncbi:MAG: sensor domain-containing diguanylate cyclase, partial [bacterium]
EDPDPIVLWVRERMMPLLVTDIRKDLRFRGTATDGLRARAVIATPLSSGATVFSVLKVESSQPDAFSMEDWRLLSLLGDLAGVAIQNALLYRRTQEEAILDGLTEVYVHRYFRERLEEEVRRSGEVGAPLTLLMADIDLFKLMNDTFGHLAGDAVLRRVARCLRDGVRGTDMVARYGGEEFAVLLVETALDAGTLVAERLRSSVAASSVRDLPNARPVTVSIGVAAFPQHATDERTLIARADEALYAAKRAGRNRVIVA